jgi:hypothetical protein
VTVNVVKVTARIRSAHQVVLVQKTAVAHQLVKSLSADRVQNDQLALIVRLAHLVLALVDLLLLQLRLFTETHF